MTGFRQLRSPILIGRDELVRMADAGLADASAGRGSFILLAGEAGLGKSRLIREIEEQAEAAGFHVVQGAVAPQDRDLPAASVLDLARTMIRTAFFAGLGRDLLDMIDAAVLERRPRRQLVHQVVDALGAALTAPTVLSFDDLQWTDDLSLEILAELARVARDRPLLLVAAYRSDELLPGSLLRDWRARLLTQRFAEELRLEPLSLDETGALAGQIIGTGGPAHPSVVRALYGRTDGVPLHIEELLGALNVPADSRSILDMAIPETLEDAVLQRMAQRSPEAQAAARAGSVIGRCFVPEVLAQLMDVEPESLDAPLRELVDHHVLLQPGERGLYDYCHQVLRDALYAGIDERERRRLHARAAECGRNLEGASEIHASLHYERAGLRSEAFRSALPAARDAARLSLHREALVLFRRAVQNMPDEVPVGEQATILLECATEAAAIEENDLAVAMGADARARFLAAGDALGATQALYALLGIERREANPLSRRLTSIEAALGEAQGLPDGPEAEQIRGLIWIERAQAAFDGLDLEGARSALTAAEQVAAPSDDPVLAYNVASLAGMIEAVSGAQAEGLDQAGQAALDARLGGFEDVGVTAYRNAAYVAARLNDTDRARAWIDEGLRYADSIEQSHCAHVMRSTGGLVAWLDGRWDDAERFGRDSLAETGCAQGSGMARWVLGYVALGRGDLDVARQQLELALEFGRRSEIPDFELAALWGLAELEVVGGRPSQAVELTQGGLELALASGEMGRFVPFVVTGVRARIEAGQPAGAARFAQAATNHLGGLASAAPALDHARGLVALAAGSLASARTNLEQASQGWDTVGRAWEAAWARLDLAGALRRSHRRVEAAEALLDARRRAEGLSSRPLLDRIATLDRLLRSHAVADESWRPLTVREFEVARLIAEGWTNAEIAPELNISRRTVAAHVEHVLAKLGLRRRAEIAAWVATVSPASRAAG
jgi:DNA-binding CsgD family transcriptional regulator